jgi:flagellar protein FliS
MENASTNTYFTQEILTASPARLVVKLYEGIITSLRKAIRAIEDKDIAARWRANKKAIDIIDHLLRTLNHEQGGEFATELERLYTFMLLHLVKVDVENDPAAAYDVIGLIEPLHRSWCALDRRMLAESTAAPQDQAPAPDDSASYGADGQPPRPAAGGRVVASA